MNQSRCDCGRLVKESSVKWSVHEFEGETYDVYEWRCSYCGDERRMVAR